MVNWSDPKEIARESDVFIKLNYVLFGLYLWEIVMTSDFEWSLIKGRRKFHWPLIFFFLCRYCMLFAFVGLIISVSVTSQINCSALYTFNSWTGNMAILSASTSLMIRTIALWERKLAVVIPLGALCAAHWGILYRGMFIVRATWSEAANTCIVTSTNPALLKITFFYTMGFDFIILCFSAAALLRHSARTHLWQLLFRDGLVYFLLSFATNSMPAIFNVLNLNPIMNIIATVPAAAVTSIAACRAVMRLLDFKTGGDVYVHSSSNATNGNNFTKSKNYSTRPEVRVTTEQITMAEFPPSPVPYILARDPANRVSSADLESAEDLDSKYEPK